ncbi:harmonin-binding protein USHBP1 isoform X1 [Entelurus aequoreus]|uniref:harmonin-binding protein USHBP1 isoform X1 n=2 Tax=Entelurus aequoreus TaxID=161455 RepID=UPI002B1E177C|nr:harmonin-binding protein USHBP1 isoform X1 [Entelurus aequoreus]
MENFSLVRCNSLDAGSGSDKELMSLYPEVEPTPAELAQCEAEVGTLLSIIAEVNKKMGSLKAPSEPGNLRPPRPPSPLFPDLLSHRLMRHVPERNTSGYVTSNPPLPSRGGRGVIWTELKGALTAVEDSINYRRSWAAPIAASDRDRPKEHLRAAQDSWAKADKILEEMEKEFGISCPSAVTKETFQEELVDHPDSAPQQGELQRSYSVSNVEDEKNKVGHQTTWRSAICSPSYRSSSTAGASSSFPCSPLLLRRAARAGGAFSPGSDGSPLSLGSPCPSPIGLPETEIERLNRYIEKLRARNERLTVALERKRAEFEQISVTFKRLEADCSAMHLALRYCEECEEAYGELLALYEAQRQQRVPVQADAAEAVDDTQQPGSPSAQRREMVSEELSTSFTTEATKEMETHSTQRTTEISERKVALHELIERLKRDRAAICLSKPRAGVEVKLNPDAGSPAGLQGGHLTKDNIKRDKTSVIHEITTAREEMSDLRALIRLKEKELRCLEWSLVAQKTQEASGACIPESLRDELEDCKTEQQRLCDNAAKLCSDGDVTGLKTRPILKEMQAVLQREQALKKRLALVYDPTLTDSASNRRDNDEHVARLTQAHSKALSSYRHIRRKYREQMWKLEQKMAAMMESQHIQRGSGEDSEWKREETVL